MKRKSTKSINKTKVKSKGNTKNVKKIKKSFSLTPDNLVPKEERIKVTLLLKKSSIAYFKKEAKKRNACYQAMIRTLLDEYVKHYN